LMDDVLLLARVDAGRTQCRPAPLDLPELCKSVAADVRSALAGACPIEFQVRKLTGPASADESLLRHILTNLLSNAVKYSEPGGVVDFSLARENREAVFIVRDHGIGIPEADQSQLFLTFHRGANVGERPGTGLGLAIVKRCVELHGGTLDLQSKQGEGTTVTVRLPLFGQLEAARPSPSARTSKRAKKKQSVARSPRRPRQP